MQHPNDCPAPFRLTGIPTQITTDDLRDAERLIHQAVESIAARCEGEPDPGSYLRCVRSALASSRSTLEAAIVGLEAHDALLMRQCHE